LEATALSADKQELQPLPTEAAAEPVLLILADISGYTRYMTANARTLSHSHTVIAELIQAIASAVEIPIELVELEGDALFLFCRNPRDPAIWMGQRETYLPQTDGVFPTLSGATAGIAWLECLHLPRLCKH